MKGIVIVKQIRFARAITLFPFIITRTKKDPVLMNHERIHLSQQLEMLIIPFYLWYGIEYLVYRIKGYSAFDAYMAISFERECDANENDFTYLRKRKLFGFVKYLK